METKIHRIRPQARAKYQPYRTLILSIIAALTMTYAALFAPPHNAEQWTYLLLLLVIIYSCIAYIIWFIGVFNTHLEVTETHIIQHFPKKTPTALAWSDISRLEEIKNNQLTLYSKSKKSKVIIFYIIEDYEVLRQLIVEKTGKKIS